MNPDRPNFTDAATAREWQAQETAAWQERLGLDAVDGGDPRVQRYRALARLLRRERLPDALPPDFANRLAQRVAADANAQAGPDLRFERGMTMALVAAFMLAAAIVVAIYGRQWLPSFAIVWPAPGGGAGRSVLAFGACVGVSWLLERYVPFRSSAR
jgi:hypothetical protein